MFTQTWEHCDSSCKFMVLLFCMQEREQEQLQVANKYQVLVADKELSLIYSNLIPSTRGLTCTSTSTCKVARLLAFEI